MLLYDTIKKYGLIGLSALGPNSHTYYVDQNHANALDADDGEHGNTWDLPFATIGYAIDINEAAESSYNMSTIFVTGDNYSEALTVLPHNCNLIAVGTRVRIIGAHTFVDRKFNVHFWGFWFSGSGAYPGITLPANCHFIGFHGCTFEGIASVTYALEVGASQETTVENCRFIGNPVVPTAIHITGAQRRTRISHNWICATTNGILIDSYDGDYGNLIDNNFISRQSADPNATEQMNYGIKMMRATGTPKWLIAKNSIEAVDGIYSATADTHFQNICIGNRVNAAGTGGWEDEGA